MKKRATVTFTAKICDVSSRQKPQLHVVGPTATSTGLDLLHMQYHTTHHVSVSPHIFWTLTAASLFYVSLACSLLTIWINPITDEMVPISPTNQLGNFPAHKKPGGIQWMALLRSAMLLRKERSSARICLWSWEQLQEENTVSYQQISLCCNSSINTTWHIIPAATSCSLMYLQLFLQ